MISFTFSPASTTGLLRTFYIVPLSAYRIARKLFLNNCRTSLLSSLRDRRPLHIYTSLDIFRTPFQMEHVDPPMDQPQHLLNTIPFNAFHLIQIF